MWYVEQERKTRHKVWVVGNDVGRPKGVWPEKTRKFDRELKWTITYPIFVRLFQIDLQSAVQVY
jgi:hypothetical protein